jgi:hypothetical protein
MRYILAVLLALLPVVVRAQTFPSPTFQNLTILGTCTGCGGGGTGNVTTTGSPLGGQIAIFSAPSSITGVAPTGTGLPVLQTGPTISAPTFTGVNPGVAATFYGVTAGGVLVTANPSGSGNVVGPGSSVAHHVAGYANTSGTLLEDEGPMPVGTISSLTGDVTGSGTGAVSTTLATVNSNTGLCGDSTHVCQVNLDGKGRTLSATPVAISGGGGGGGFTIGSPITGGTPNGLIYDNAGNIGNLATASNGMLVTNGAGLPSISTTAPSGMTFPSPIITGSFTATGLVTLADMASMAANSVLGNGSGGAASPAVLTMPNCPPGGGNTLNYTLGGGSAAFGCGTVSGSSGANPTALAGPVAINGSSGFFTRADGAPAVQKGSDSQFGIVESDGSTLTCPSGVCSVKVVPITSVSGLDNTSATDPGITAANMGSQINFSNSGGITVVLPAKATGLWQPGQTLLLVAQGAGTVTLTNSTTLTAAGTCSSIASGSSLEITANSDATHLDCTPRIGTAGGTGNVSNVGTPTNGQLAQWTGATTVQGITTGTGVATALGVNVGSAGAVVVNGGAGGTPLSLTLTNATGLPNSSVGAAPLPTPGSGATLVGPRSYYVCTTTCSVTPPTPAAGYEFCVRNDDNVSTVITFAAITSVQFENTNYTSYKTANTSIVSGGAAGDKMCVLGRDATHYMVMSFNGTWS